MRTSALLLAAAVFAGVACTSDDGVFGPGAGTSAPTTTAGSEAGTTAATPTTAAEPSSSVAVDDEPIPVDEDVRILTLGNGLQVYLRHNERPGAHADLHLVVDAGSAQ